MYGRARRTTGLTLIEMTLVIAVVALMVAFGTPAMRALVNSFQSEGGAVTMVNAALGSARAMAVNRQRYVGVRFQKMCTSTDADAPLKGLMDAPQYMIFIMHEEMKNNGDVSNGFRAMEGLEPVKLPMTLVMMDVSQIAGDGDIDEPRELSDATTFSVVFSPSGKLLVHNVRVRNKDGINRPLTGLTPQNPSLDDTFNVADTIFRFGRGRFIQDDYPRGDSVLDLGLGEEISCESFVICELPRLRAAYERKTAWTTCLGELAGKAYYVSPHTGDLIASD
ncbi:MAG: hypothetical protein ABFD90_12105 [Phycisphaerales bacterium]